MANAVPAPDPADPAPRQVARYGRWPGRLRSYLAVAMVVAAGLLPPLGLRDDVLSALTLAFYYVILASCWNLLAGYTGQFSLAQHTFAVIGGYSTGLSIVYLGFSIAQGIVVATVFSALLGALLGATFLRLRAIYFAIATWAFANTVQIVLTAAYQVTRGQLGLSVPPLIASLDPGAFYYVFFALMLGCVAAIALVVRSRIGQFLKAIKDDELRAASLGVDTTRWKVFAFSFTSCLSGLAGAFYAHYVLILSPSMAEFTVIANIVMMVIVGGIATLAGPVVGGLIVGVLSFYLQRYGAWNIVLFSLIVLVIMRTSRRGLALLARDGWWWLRGRLPARGREGPGEEPSGDDRKQPAERKVPL